MYINKLIKGLKAYIIIANSGICGQIIFIFGKLSLLYSNLIHQNLLNIYSGPSRLKGGPTEYRPHLGHR